MNMTKHNAALQAAAMKRAAKVAKLKASGMTYAEIGAALNISRQRAQQIASRAGK